MLSTLNAHGTRSRSGMTAIELLIASIILLVALLAFASSMAASASLRAVTLENGIATDAAGNMLERLHETDFDEVFATYNANPEDDPDGPGTAPGNRFAVAGLLPIAAAADGLVGEVIFPTLEVQASEVDPLAGPGEMITQLRENVVDLALGMPRDLNGDMIIDTADHALDYFLLPVRIELRWQGKNGARRHHVYSMLCEFPRQ